jgi:hypothetical protein
MKFSALFTATGLALGLSAFAQTNDCDQIRSVKKLANQRGLDDSTLTTLEAQYCNTGASQDCYDVSVLSRLASISSNDAAFLKQTNKKANNVCSAGNALGSWQNGTYVQDNSGNLYYPNGSYAKNSKKWFYVNGNTARSNKDEWYYPNGNFARDSKKNWYDPNGNSLTIEDLLTKACNKVSDSLCNSAIQEIKVAVLDEKAAAIIQFTWHAWNQASDNYDNSSSNASQDCTDLTLMHRLAVLDGADSSLLKIVSVRQKTVCSGSNNTSDWSTGKTSKFKSGAWDYPNGKTAKYSSGAWNYPNGKSAKYSNGGWNYPSGKSAKYANGKWADPDGNWISVEELLTRSCEKLPDAECSRGLGYIKSASGEEKTLAIIELVVLAWSWQDNSYTPTPTPVTPTPSYDNSSNSQDCSTLDLMGRIAFLGGGSNDVQSTIHNKRKAVCASNSSNSSFNWSNGLSAKSSGGSWYYPNGITAKSSNGTWYYPNGITTKSSTGTWYYPNGITAKSSTGTWYAPGGVSIAVDDLLTKACEKLPTNLCNQGIDSIRSMSGDEKTFGIIEFVQTAWNY